MTRPTLVSGLLALTLLSSAAAQTPLQDTFKSLSDDERTYFQHVATLSNPFFEGRAPGLRGNQLAAEYVEFNFRKIGLTPGFPGVQPEGGAGTPAPFSSFRQAFSTGKETKPKAQALSYTAGGAAVTLKPGADFTVRGISGAGQVERPVVFVGYGIAEGKDGYNSFEGLKEGEDLSGRIALLLRFEPLNDAGKSRWSDSGRFSNRSTLAGKLRALADRKAAAVLLVSPPGVDDPRAKTIEDTASSTAGTMMAMPVINLHVDAATAMLAAAGADLAALRRQADERGGIQEIPGLTVNLDAAVAREPNATDNVAGVLAGRGSLKDDYLIVGAHFDHVGYGLFGSRTNEAGKLHPGADDNASGTAGLIMLASRIAADYQKLPEGADARSIIFVAFSGEEGGLIGSRHMVKNSPVPASRVYAMLNMDMIGRARHDKQGRPKCEAAGVGTAKGFSDLLKPIFEDSGVAVKTLPGGQGPSDHASFYRANIPVLHFFTGLHDQYHAPTDTYSRIEPAGAMKIVDLVRTVATTLATRAETLEFTQASGPGIDYNEPTEEAPIDVAGRPATDEELETLRKARDAAAAARDAAQKNAPAATPAAPSKRARTPEAPANTPSATPAPGTGSGRAGSRVRFGIQPGDYSEGGGGLQVGDVFPNTSAAEAGLKQGDVITKWNDAPISGVQDWMPHLGRAKPGDTVKLTVKRGDETLILNATLKAAD
ncbi:MAG TPA: M28 family peptidase [Phycisphaerales bacterium]|nr:M28 family peptidase [Phycisphaerales bacterium]